MRKTGGRGDVVGVAVFKGTSFLYFFARDSRRSNEATASLAVAEAARVGGECVVTTLRAYERARAEQAEAYALARHAAVSS